MSVNAPIELKTKLSDEDMRNSVQLERYVTVAGHDVRRRAKMPGISDSLDPEVICKVFEEFRDVATANRLHLSTGQLKFEYF